ncbi:hypothetical protein HGA91_05625 [candidate division WWE3 bacterium]|nr:hypothetical protein [candidate division WWE3 bacterium]
MSLHFDPEKTRAPRVTLLKNDGAVATRYATLLRARFVIERNPRFRPGLAGNETMFVVFYDNEVELFTVYDGGLKRTASLYYPIDSVEETIAAIRRLCALQQITSIREAQTNDIVLDRPIH